MGALAKELLKKMYDVDGREETKETVADVEKKLKSQDADRKAQSKEDTSSPELG